MACQRGLHSWTRLHGCVDAWCVWAFSPPPPSTRYRGPRGSVSPVEPFLSALQQLRLREQPPADLHHPMTDPSLGDGAVEKNLAGKKTSTLAPTLAATTKSPDEAPRIQERRKSSFGVGSLEDSLQERSKSQDQQQQLQGVPDSDYGSRRRSLEVAALTSKNTMSLTKPLPQIKDLDHDRQMMDLMDTWTGEVGGGGR